MSSCSICSKYREGDRFSPYKANASEDAIKLGDLLEIQEELRFGTLLKPECCDKFFWRDSEDRVLFLTADQLDHVREWNNFDPSLSLEQKKVLDTIGCANPEMEAKEFPCQAKTLDGEVLPYVRVVTAKHPKGIAPKNWQKKEYYLDEVRDLEPSSAAFSLEFRKKLHFSNWDTHFPEPTQGALYQGKEYVIYPDSHFCAEGEGSGVQLIEKPGARPRINVSREDEVVVLCDPF